MTAPADGVDPVTGALAEIRTRTLSNDDGAVADYIPELAHADPEHCGLALASIRGQVYAVGDAEQPFTIQSVAKPFVYALAVADRGLEQVLEHVGCEPSGEPFNAISLDDAGRPANPMINAGAIVATDLVRGADPHERFGRILQVLSGFAGRDLDVDEAVFASESATGDRNRALGYLARAAGVLPHPVSEATEVYFRACAVRVTAVDLALMGATLANAGVHPRTGDRVVDARTARHTLAVMASCGMYDRSGEWGLRVGLPAKSGVGGGIVAVMPGQVGIGTYAPRLDDAGNSARGVAALTMLSQQAGLHLLEHAEVPVTPVVGWERSEGQWRLTLRGELGFIDAEHVAALVEAAASEENPARALVIDSRAVTAVAPVAVRLLKAVRERVQAAGWEVLDA